MSDQAFALLVLVGAPVVLGALFWLIVFLEGGGGGSRRTPFDPPPRRRHRRPPEPSPSGLGSGAPAGSSEERAGNGPPALS